MTWIAYDTYAEGRTHSVVGEVHVWRGLVSPQLGNSRDILVYLPPSYAESTQRYPLLFMHDGQNLFDGVTSYAGEWQVDETLQALSEEGIEAIVVGLPNAGEERLNEYSPYKMARVGGGKADAYLRFIIETVRPLILESFRASAERRSTGLFGSSMGGLISLYGFFAYPEHFGLVGAMSPSLWFAGGRILDYIRKRPPILGKIYFDVGSEERSLRATRSIAQLYDAQLNEILLKKGYRPEKDMVYVLEEGASHNEAYWARRLPEALRFLLTE